MICRLGVPCEAETTWNNYTLHSQWRSSAEPLAQVVSRGCPLRSETHKHTPCFAIWQTQQTNELPAFVTEEGLDKTCINNVWPPAWPSRLPMQLAPLQQVTHGSSQLKPPAHVNSHRWPGSIALTVLVTAIDPWSLLVNQYQSRTS